MPFYRRFGQVFYCFFVFSGQQYFFFNQLKAKYDIFSSPVSDFQIDGMTFAIGGKSKTRKQIKDIETGFVVKDNIEFGYSNIIPRWHFGMLY
jgi:hypothetical protein